jgi:hypothetical protein
LRQSDFKQYAPALAYGIGPGGHMLTSTTTQYPSGTLAYTAHWDGGDVLFETSAGQLLDVKVGKLGLLGGVVRDWTGAVTISDALRPQQRLVRLVAPISPTHREEVRTCAGVTHPESSPHFSSPASDQGGFQPLPFQGMLKPPGLDG